MPMDHWDIETKEDLAEHIRQKLQEFGQYTTNFRTISYIIAGMKHLRSDNTREAVDEFASAHDFTVNIVDCELGNPWVVFRKND